VLIGRALSFRTKDMGDTSSEHVIAFAGHGFEAASIDDLNMAPPILDQSGFLQNAHRKRD